MNPSPVSSSNPTKRKGGVYTEAREKTNKTQVAIRTGRPEPPGYLHKSGGTSSSEGETVVEDRDTRHTDKNHGIKKPRNFSGEGADLGLSKGLPITSVELDVTWIPENSNPGDDWIRTITIRDLLRQLKSKKVRLLIDLEDKSFLTVEEESLSNDDDDDDGDDDDDDIDMK